MTVFILSSVNLLWFFVMFEKIWVFEWPRDENATIFLQALRSPRHCYTACFIYKKVFWLSMLKGMIKVAMLCCCVIGAVQSQDESHFGNQIDQTTVISL